MWLSQSRSTIAKNTLKIESSVEWCSLTFAISNTTFFRSSARNLLKLTRKGSSTISENFSSVFALYFKSLFFSFSFYYNTCCCKFATPIKKCLIVSSVIVSCAADDFTPCFKFKSFVSSYLVRHPLTKTSLRVRQQRLPSSSLTKERQRGAESLKRHSSWSSSKEQEFLSVFVESLIKLCFIKIEIWSWSSEAAKFCPIREFKDWGPLLVSLLTRG